MKWFGGHPQCRNNISQAWPNVIFMNLDGLGSKVDQFYKIPWTSIQIKTFARFWGGLGRWEMIWGLEDEGIRGASTLPE